MTVFFGNGSGNTMADRRYEMAVAYLRDNDHEAAADLLRQAIELVPSWPPLHFYLGEAHRQAGQMAEALAA
jgi:predicted TPR repeat methyltransferase